MKILIDNGHGNNTKGKCSPDLKFYEYLFCRNIASAVVSQLRSKGYDAELLVPELYDVPLLERVHRVNVKCQSIGKSNVIVVSVHCNAAGDGSKWMKGTGWECWTSEGRTDSDRLAEHLVSSAERSFPGKKIRIWKPIEGERDKEKNFTILKSTLCPAVLTENFFMDSKDDLKFLKSEEGFQAIVGCHVDGIISYINER